MPQHQSPLFRLPRELRDEIYKYSLLETGGYFYDPASGRLRTAQGTPINVALCLTCKQAADETHTLTLQGNTVRFTSFADNSPNHNARNFEHSQDRCFNAILSMLAWAAQCVTSDHLEIMRSRYPHNPGVCTLRAATTASRKTQLEQCGIPDPRSMSRHVTSRAIHGLLELIQKEPEFQLSTAKEYDGTLRDGHLHPRLAVFQDYDVALPRPNVANYHNPAYIEGSQQRIIELYSRPWDMPGSVALDEMAKLMPEHQWLIDSRARREGALGERKLYCYSGTASAIRFLEELSSEHRTTLRKIVIEERQLSVCDMESHAHGLIPYCKENPKLRVQIKVNVWHTVLLEHCDNDGDPVVSSTLDAVAKWLSEASSLTAQGMPKDQCTIFLGGAEPELLEPLWNAIKRAAALCEAAQHIREQQPGHRLNPLLFGRWPTNFHVLVKQGFNGGIPLRFDAPLGEAWDVSQAIHDLDQFSPRPLFWEDVIDLSALDRHAHIWEPMRKEYYVVD